MSYDRRSRCGAIRQADGLVRWEVWASRASSVELVLHGHAKPMTWAMSAQPDGYFAKTLVDIPDHQRYTYRLDRGPDRADPCSLWQPEGVTGPSALFSPRTFTWHDQQWIGILCKHMVLYELHVGTFTPEGTFEAVIARLPALKELGITAIEIMPIAQFPGSRNWGYDGILPYAAQNTYGGPRGLMKLVDACHVAGLAAVLDVVYNHFGPEHNYLHEFGPYYTDRHKTPWGTAINYDDRGCDGVRKFVVDNAAMWLREFHLDGLRLDAVHAIYDMGARHLLKEIQDIADETADETGRHTHVIAESDLNDPRVIAPPDYGGWGLDAQWADDFHHAVHAQLTGERRGYYADYPTAFELTKAFQTPFVYAGDYSPNRGRRHGAPLPTDTPGDHFVVAIQNHDQVGNRAKGDRLSTILHSLPKQRLAASLMLLSPYVPMLFMGEEYGEERPFPFFCSFGGKELIEAVRQGRKREFADFVDSPNEIPDPAAEETFRSAILSWSWPDNTPHAAIRHLYQDLITARQRWPALHEMARRGVRLFGGQGNPVIELIRGDTTPQPGRTLQIYFNLTAQEQNIPVPLLPETTPLFSSESHRYCGTRQDMTAADHLLPFECLVFGPNQWA